MFNKHVRIETRGKFPGKSARNKTEMRALKAIREQKPTEKDGGFYCEEETFAVIFPRTHERRSAIDQAIGRASNAIKIHISFYGTPAFHVSWMYLG